MAVCGFYTTVFPEKARLGNSILHSPPRLCRPASVLRTAEPFSGLIILLLYQIIVQNWNMGQDVRKILAENVRSLRTSRNLKREALSLTLGFDNSYISKLEKASMNITLDKLTKIADYFDIEVYKLLKK